VIGVDVAVEMGLTPDSQWAVDLPELVATAQAAGFSTLGLAAGKAGTAAETIYAAAGVRCHELLALVVTADADATLSAAERLAEGAAAMRADWVLTVFNVGLDVGTAETIRRCAAMFATAGSRMAVEFMPIGPVTSVRAGLEVVEVAAAGQAALLIDSWHFCLGDSRWQDLADVPLEQIAYIQFSDATEPESDDLMRETLNRRRLPGEGILDLDRFASTLLERGWEGTVSVEVLNQELRSLPILEIARRAYDSAARFWS
jgi:sugar phosphate isomerase/epimerase